MFGWHKRPRIDNNEAIRSVYVSLNYAILFWNSERVGIDRRMDSRVIRSSIQTVSRRGFSFFSRAAQTKAIKQYRSDEHVLT